MSTRNPTLYAFGKKKKSSQEFALTEEDFHPHHATESSQKEFKEEFW